MNTPTQETSTPDAPTPDNSTNASSTKATPTSRAVTKKNPYLPFIAGGLGLGMLAFVAGRSTAPNPPANMGTNQAGQSGLAADEHAEGEEHKEGEAGHAEHGEEEAGHEEEGHAAGEAGHGEEGEAGHGEEGHKEGEAESETIVFEGDSAREAGITLQTVALEAQTSGIPFNGQITTTPNGVVRVASVVPGRVTRLFVSPGDRVRRGQTLAIVESRAIGEAQSAYQQASARLQNARANFNVVSQQARAGVFARAPLEAARRAQVDASADVRAQEVAVRQARVALDNAQRLARAGSFASPAIEAARAQRAQAEESLRTAQAALSNASASVRSAGSELQRRRQIASGGGYASRIVDETRRSLVAAQSARAAAQSEVATTRANLARARSLAAEGLVSQRDLEAAQNAFETATARLETAQADERTAQTELTRQQRLASTNVAGTAEVGQAQSQLAAAQADVRTRNAETQRARESVRLADAALRRETSVLRGGVANRRELSGARGSLATAQNALVKARQTRQVADAAYERERRIFRQNLNNISQVQAARSTLVGAQSDLRAAQTALALFKSAPGGRASVPITAPIAGVVQSREVAPGEVLDADANLMTLVNLNTLAVEAAIPESSIARVRPGSQVKLTVAAVPGRAFTGQINYLASQLNPQTRTLTARALIPGGGGLRPGMFARGQIVTALAGAAVTVPADAIQDLEGEKMVFVAGKEANHFEKRAVEVGATQNGRALIKSGLKPGERIVVTGAFTVKAQAMKAELGHGH